MWSDNVHIKIFTTWRSGFQVIILTLLFHRIIFILFITIIIFESHCVELIYLLMIFLTVASLHGTICLVSSLIQSLLLRLSVLDLLICPYFWTMPFGIAIWLLCLCVHLCIQLRVITVLGIALAVLYPVITTECASLTSQLLIAVFIEYLLNY